MFKKSKSRYSNLTRNELEKMCCRLERKLAKAKAAEDEARRTHEADLVFEQRKRNEIRSLESDVEKLSKGLRALINAAKEKGVYEELLVVAAEYYNGNGKEMI